MITRPAQPVWSAGPDFEKPGASVSDSWLEAHDPRIDTSSVAYKDWWLVFNDPVLVSLIESAYQQNLNLQVAGLRILEARAMLGIATGLQYPQSQSVQGSGARSRSSTNAPPLANLLDDVAGRINPTVNAWSTSFDIAWQADVWGRFRRGVEAANANLAANMLNYNSVLVTLRGGWQLHEGNPYVNSEITKTMNERTNWGEYLDNQPQTIPSIPAAK